MPEMQSTDHHSMGAPRTGAPRTGAPRMGVCSTEVPGTSQPGLSTGQCVLVGLVFFAVGYVGALLFKHADDISKALHEASLARHEIMSGDRGPVTFLAFNNDLPALQLLAENHTDILGVEQSDRSNVAKIAFVSLQSPAIPLVANQPYVGEMIQKNVPMICH